MSKIYEFGPSHLQAILNLLLLLWCNLGDGNKPRDRCTWTRENSKQFLPLQTWAT